MISATVTGIDDLRRELAALAPKLRVRALRNALAAGARLVRDESRRATPVISAGDPAVFAGRRKPGTVRKAIVVRTSKVARKRGDVGVFVNVRPLPGNKYKTVTSKGLFGKRTTYKLVRASKRGANNPNDPYYWRWLNYGWNPASGAGRFGRAARRERRSLNQSGAPKRVPGAKFLEAGIAKLGAARDLIMPRLLQAIEKLNRPKAPAP
jgi:hypothetical protein